MTGKYLGILVWQTNNIGPYDNHSDDKQPSKLPKTRQRRGHRWFLVAGNIAKQHRNFDHLFATQEGIALSGYCKSGLPTYILR